jgi:hypothetical protein
MGRHAALALVVGLLSLPGVLACPTGTVPAGAALPVQRLADQDEAPSAAGFTRSAANG